MTQFIVKDTDSGNSRPAETRSEAQSIKSDMEGLGMDCEIIPPGEGENQTVNADGGPEIVDHTEEPQGGEEVEENPPEESPTEQNDPPETAHTDGYDLPEGGPSVDEDPLVWMPDEFTDTIDGTVAINRKGFEVLAHHYDIQCETELVEPLTEDGRVTFKATAIDAEGDRYSAFGSASQDRGDDMGLLVEMADTRAYKRAVSRSTGVGVVAIEELKTLSNHKQ